MRIRRGVSKPKRLVNIEADKFNLGYMDLMDESRLPVAAARESTNLMQVQDGLWQTKWGSAFFGIAPTASDIDGAGEYVLDEDSTELIVISNGKAYKTVDAGANWTEITGATFTPGTQCFFLQINSFLYITNGVDNLTRYNGATLARYSSLAAPADLALARTTLTSGTFNVYYQVVAVNEVGFTPACAEVSIGNNKIRDQWATGENVKLTWSAVAGAVRYEIYYSDQSGSEVYLGSTPDLTFTDDGTSQPNPYVEAPVDNTTTGPKFTSMELSGNRIWGTRDPDNKWRVYFGGTGQYQGYFSPFFGGGYVDLEKGGREFPSAVTHFKDGKGGAYPTVLTSDPKGEGSIWQVILETVTVGTESFIIPAPIKIIGSVGSNAPLSVAKAKDNIFYANNRGMFTTGSKPTLLNVLSTDEISGNIRPTWKSIDVTNAKNICSYAYDAKLFISIPYGSSSNNKTILMDLERRNWAVSWTIGIKQFLEHTVNGKTYFLGVPVTGTKLVQFSENIQGDLGQAFNTSYMSGLIPVSRDETEWAKAKYLYVEFGRPQGAINVELIGTEKKKGYSSVKTTTIRATTSNVGFSSQNFSDFNFSDTSLAPVVFASASIKKKIRINKLLNNFVVKITTNTLDAKYTLLSWRLKGVMVKTKEPVAWRS